MESGQILVDLGKNCSNIGSLRSRYGRELSRMVSNW
jgi:hypothetical protein